MWQWNCIFPLNIYSLWMLKELLMEPVRTRIICVVLIWYLISNNSNSPFKVLPLFWEDFPLDILSWPRVFALIQTRPSVRARHQFWVIRSGSQSEFQSIPKVFIGRALWMPVKFFTSNSLNLFFIKESLCTGTLSCRTEKGRPQRWKRVIVSCSIKFHRALPNLLFRCLYPHPFGHVVCICMFVPFQTLHESNVREFEEMKVRDI